MYLHIKRFIDKISLMESKQNKDVVLPIADARGLRDELSKLLLEMQTLHEGRDKARETEVIKVELTGAPFK